MSEHTHDNLVFTLDPADCPVCMKAEIARLTARCARLEGALTDALTLLITWRDDRVVTEERSSPSIGDMIEQVRQALAATEDV